MEAKLKVIICRGLPGSGKTTFAKEYIKKNLFSKTVRINRDDIREMMGITYNEQSELFVKEIEEKMITAALDGAMDVIVDDTNIYSSGAELIKQAIDNSKYRDYVEIEYKSFFDVPLWLCFERNSEREESKRVPAQRLEQMLAYYEKYGKKFENILKRK